jgi:hypothetical protein
LGENCANAFHAGEGDGFKNNASYHAGNCSWQPS